MYLCVCMCISVCLNIYVCISVYVCMYVCIYICMNVCMYVEFINYFCFQCTCVNKIKFAYTFMFPNLFKSFVFITKAKHVV